MAAFTAGCVLVGEAPNLATVGRPDLWLLPDRSGIPHAANRLLAITEWDAETFLATFTIRTNVLDYAPAASWRPRDRREARRVAVLLLTAHPERPFVLLGRRAADAFGLDPERGWFRWTAVPSDHHLAAVPHPSGRSRLWNDPEVVRLARSFFDAMIATHGSRGPATT